MRVILLSIFLSISTAAIADDDTPWFERIVLHGFASQGYIHTTDNHFFGPSDDGSFEFTEVGINGSLSLNPKLRLSAQLLSRQAGRFDNGSPRLDYGLIDISLYSSTTYSSGLYIGRIKNEIGLYNETRDVAHTRSAIFLPQVIYFDKVRNTIMAADGVHFYNNLDLDSGTVFMEVGTGYTLADKNVEYAYMGDDWAGSIQNDKLGIFGKLLYEHNGGQWIYSITGTRVTLDFDAGASDRVPFPFGPGMNSGEIEIDYTVLSGQYNGEKWQFTSEVAFENVDYLDIGGPVSQMNINSIGYYLQANYNFTPAWQAFIRYEEFQLNKHDWNGKKAARQNRINSQQLAANGINRAPVPAHEYYSKSWVLGGRWHISQNLMLRTEYHIVEGVATLSPRENDVTDTHKRWDMFAVSLSYRF